jgi:hypothetical protein
VSNKAPKKIKGILPEKTHFKTSGSLFYTITHKGLDLLKCAQNYDIFGFVLAFYSIRAVTTLTVVECGSPRLRIAKSG